jgi:hypothetical protein
MRVAAFTPAPVKFNRHRFAENAVIARRRLAAEYNRLLNLG